MPRPTRRIGTTPRPAPPVPPPTLEPAHAPPAHGLPAQDRRPTAPTAPTRPRPRRALASILISLGLLAGAGGCRSGKGSPEPEPTATTTTAHPRSTTSRPASPRPGATTSPPRSTTTAAATPTSTTPPTPETAATKAYLAAVADYFEVARHPDPDDPRLARHRTGASLQHIRDLLTTFKAAGIVVKYPAGLSPIPAVVATRIMGAARVSVTACLIDDGVQVRSADGFVVDDQVLSELTQADLRRQDGVWRVTDQVRLRTRPGRSGCL